LATDSFNEDKENFEIFPNPTDDLLNFFIEDKAEVSIYNLSGKKINSSTVITKENNSVSLQSQSNGIYIVEIISNNKKSTQRIVKK
jgi:hypothetical protein